MSQNTASMRQLAVDTMSDAHQYFDKKTAKDAIKHATEIKELIKAPRPVAVEDFTLKDMEAKAKQQLTNKEAMEGLAPLAVKFFTTKARLETNTKQAEIQALKENPLPPTAAGQHFAMV